MHEDVVMRLLSKSFGGDVGFWFQNLKSDSIGSWEELHDVFLSIGVRINLIINFFLNFLKRENAESITKFNWRFQSFYISMPIEIIPSKKLAIVYYVMAQHSDLVFYLLERKSSYLR